MLLCAKHGITFGLLLFKRKEIILIILGSIYINCTITPHFYRFSISSEILIDFELTLFLVLTSPADIGKSGLPSTLQKTCNLFP